MNTVVNALVTFIHLREEGLAVEAAFDFLGLYGGDDGITLSPNPENFQRTVQRLGLKVKASVKVPGDPISFLGRYFGELYTGSPNNCCDPARLRKSLAWTNDPQCDPVEKLKEKILAYSITDPQTSFVQRYIKEVEQKFGPLGSVHDADNYWASKAISEGPFTNIYATWMDDLDSSLGLFDKSNKPISPQATPDVAVLNGVPLKPIEKGNVIVHKSQIRDLAGQATKLNKSTVRRNRKRKKKGAEVKPVNQLSTGPPAPTKAPVALKLNITRRGNPIPAHPVSPRGTGTDGGAR
jgi:hypothetical protein